jgi:hypothetical protein
LTAHVSFIKHASFVMQLAKDKKFRLFYLFALIGT